MIHVIGLRVQCWGELEVNRVMSDDVAFEKLAGFVFESVLENHSQLELPELGPNCSCPTFGGIDCDKIEE